MLNTQLFGDKLKSLGYDFYSGVQCSFLKVRAEKRACFKSLPDILAFNTMRYSFNMVTMMKEKVNINFIFFIFIHINPIVQVNTHFSFPFQLDMSAYMEHTLIPGKVSKSFPKAKGS